MAMLAIGIASPVVYMFIRGSITSQDASLEQAARTAGASPVRALMSVTVPLLRPALLNSALIVFALSLEVLAVPLILGSSSNIAFIATFLYNRWLNTVPSQQGLVSAGAVVLLLTVTLLLVLRNRLTGDTARFQTVGGKATGPGASAWDRPAGRSSP